MKYKKRLKNLETRQKQWDSFPRDVQSATTRPGSKNK
jgi:hypothetical protein